LYHTLLSYTPLIHSFSFHTHALLSGKYIVRGVTYLEGAHHQEKLVSGMACQVFIEDEDDWCEGTIARINEVCVPNTEIKFRKYFVTYKKGKQEEEAEGGDSAVERPKHISRQQLEEFYDTHDPEKKANINTILANFSAEQIEQNMTAKYGDAPEAMEGAAEEVVLEVGADAIRLIQEEKEPGEANEDGSLPAPAINEATGLGGCAVCH
jgi:hypothetical protein